MEEGRGTCSSKHALLAQWAKAYGAGVDLALGVFERDAASVPPIAPYLEHAPIDAFPEARGYLISGGKRIDLTHPSAPEGGLSFLSP
jgi:hypothetical protein